METISDHVNGEPNDIPGYCDGFYHACHQYVNVGEGVWSWSYRDERWFVQHSSGTYCQRGWVYLIGGVGPGGCLIKIGKVIRYHGFVDRIKTLYEKQWLNHGYSLRPNARNFWASAVPSGHEAESRALMAMRPFRAFPLLDPAHPNFSEWMAAHPRPPDDASQREHLAWAYMNKASAQALARSIPTPRKTPGWTELFRGDLAKAATIVSAAIGTPLQEFRYDPLCSAHTEESDRDEQEAAD